MSIESTRWGDVDGANVSLFVIRNDTGASLVLSDYGATLIQMNMPAPDGILADVVLGFDTLGDYLASPTYFGASVGRFGNRIRKGRFELDGVKHQVSCNEGSNSLHGGANGFDKRIWSAAVNEAGNSVTFSLVSPDGDQGFPGKLTASSTYTLTDDNIVRMELRAETDKTTLCNMVHHSYFNVAGHNSGSILDHEMCIHSDFYTPVDDELIITGEVLKVGGTPFDFTTARPIGAKIDQVPNAGAGYVDEGVIAGYDHNWCLRGEPFKLRPVVTVRDPKSGRGFELSTNQPGVHFYTAGYLTPEVVGKGGHPYGKFTGITFETQTFPDSPNLSHVHQARLEPGDSYYNVMEFKFFS